MEDRYRYTKIKEWRIVKLGILFEQFVETQTVQLQNHSLRTKLFDISITKSY